MKRIVLLLIVLTLPSFGFSAQNHLDLIQPNGGEVTFGTHHNVKWDCNFNDMMNILLYKGNSEVGKIAVNVPSHLKTYKWKVGYLIRKHSVEGQGFKIKIVAKSSSLSAMSKNYFVISRSAIRPQNLSAKLSKKQTHIITPQTYSQQSNAKPDMIVANIVTYLQRNTMTGPFTGNMFINEPLELDVRIQNIFAEYGHTRNNFKIKVQFRYGYSGPVHKEKIVMVRKNLEPGESITKRIVYGKVKGTPNVLFIKVIADSTNTVKESNENNNKKEISVRIVNPN